MGHWIGGDRDGNPNVTAATLAHALKRQAEVVLRFYLTEVHELGAELSISGTLSTGVAPDAGAGRGLARPATRTSPGRALPPRADRHVRPPGGHAAGAHRHRGACATRWRRRTPMPSPEAFVARPAGPSSASLCSPTTRWRLVGPRLAPLKRAVQVFGFHLATLDLRQSSDKHEAVVAELLRVARVEPDYGALPEAARRACLLALLNDARPLRVHGARPTARWHCDELAIFETAREALGPLRRARHCATTSSATPKR